MEKQDIYTQHKGIAYSISKGRLHDAFAALWDLATHVNEYGYVSEIEELARAYNYMLEYFEKGSSDPERKQFLLHLTAKVFSLNDRLYDYLCKRYNCVPLYYQKQGEIAQFAATAQVTDAIQELQLRLMDACYDNMQENNNQGEILLQQIFYAIWTNFPASDIDTTIIGQLLIDDNIPLYQREFFISALTLNILQWYDEGKILLLLNAIQTEKTPSFLAKAWVGLLFAICIHRERFQYSPSIVMQMDEIRDKQLREDGASPLLTLLLLMYQAEEAGTVSDTISKDIEPQLREIQEQIKQRHPRQSNSSTWELEEFTPEFEEMLNKSGIDGKIKEIREMHRDGADIMYSTFAGMKHIPFFKQLSNWLLPFSTEHPAVVQLCTSHPALKPVAQNIGSLKFLCDTDKYAFLINLSSIPTQQQDIALQAFNGQEEVMKATANEAQDEQFKTLARSYIHDLYRLFTMHPQKAELNNPFEDLSLIHKNCIIAPWVDNAKSLAAIANFLFRHKKYLLACEIFQDLYQIDKSENCLQKYAYSLDQEPIADKELAEQILLECNDLYPNVVWTNRYLATFYMRQHQYYKAIPHLKTAEELLPQHTGIALQFGNCLFKLGNYKDALQKYFKADILKDGLTSAQKNIAWCSLLIGNNDTAESYIKKVLVKTPASFDWYLGGLIALQKGDVQKAIERLSHCLMGDDAWDLNTFHDNFIIDNTKLNEAHIDRDLLKLVCETVQKNYCHYNY